MKKPSVARKNRPCFSSLSECSRRAHIIGVSVSEISAEMATATLRVMANSRNRRPTMPVMNSRGMNTAISETLSDTMVKPISFAPSSAASIGAFPASMCRTMFSIITMASSTTKPVEIVSAMSDRLSRLKPSSFITPKVAISVSGRAMLGMTVAQNFRRKTKITSTTSAIVSTSVNCTSVTEARMVSVRSPKMDSVTDEGSESRSLGSSAFTWSAVWMMFAPGWRWMSTSTAGRPPTQLATRTFSTLSTASPRSATRTGEPFR